MAQHPSRRTIEALDSVISQIQTLHDHPRMQQNNWVRGATTWLPVLMNAREDLSAKVEPYTLLAESHQAILNALAQVGLQLHQLSIQSWAFSWDGGAPVGNFASQAQAISAALHNRLTNDPSLT